MNHPALKGEVSGKENMSILKPKLSKIAIIDSRAQHILMFIRLTELNLVEEGNSSLCFKTEVSLPLM